MPPGNDEVTVLAPPNYSLALATTLAASHPEARVGGQLLHLQSASYAALAYLSLRWKAYGSYGWLSRISQKPEMESILRTKKPSTKCSSWPEQPSVMICHLLQRSRTTISPSPMKTRYLVYKRHAYKLHAVFDECREIPKQPAASRDLYCGEVASGLEIAWTVEHETSGQDQRSNRQRTSDMRAPARAQM